MTVRDRILLGVFGLVVLIGAYWLLLLSPQREQAGKLEQQVTSQRQALAQAQADAGASRAARASYASDYATVAQLGKAVPVQDDVPSLVYQLDSAAHSAGIDFRSVKLLADGAGASSGAGAGAAKAPPPASGAKPAASGSAPAGGSKPAAAGAAAPPTEAAAATLPPGATVGPAGLPTMPFSFTFQGSFFHLADFFRKLDRFISARPGKLQVNGRLLTVNGVSLSAGPKGFPQVEASIVATAYLLPGAEGLLNGASPTGPASPSGSAAASTATSSPGPATATATP